MSNEWIISIANSIYQDFKIMCNRVLHVMRFTFKYQKHPTEVFCKKGVLKNSQISQENTC